MRAHGQSMILATLATIGLATAGAAHAGPAALAGAQDADEQELTLTFPGGTAAEYVELIRATADEMNLVTMPGVELVKLPRIELKRVTVRGALSLLDGRTAQLPDRFVELSVDEGGPWGEADVYLVDAEVQVISGPTLLRFSVETVADILASGIDAADLSAAIETALGLFPSESGPAQVKFHEETGLILVWGTQEHVQAVHAVIGELRRGIERSQSSARAAEETAEALQQRDELRDVNAHLKAQVEEAHVRMTELETQNQLIANSAQDAREAQAQVSQWRMECEALKREIDDLRRALAEREDQIEALRKQLHDGAGRILNDR